MADDEVIDTLVEELRPKEPMELALRPQSVLTLAGLLQLALRHPALDGTPRDFAVAFVHHARAYFADCPAALDVLRRGDDPQEDR